MDFVAEIEPPPKPDLTATFSHKNNEGGLPPTPPPPAPRPRTVPKSLRSLIAVLFLRTLCCMLMSGDEESILTKIESPADQHGHGTMVSGLAVFGDVRACYDAKNFSSPVWLYSARVLNDQNCFDDEKLIFTQMRNAVRHFKAVPYGCRVFNISIGGFKRPMVDMRGRQSEWAEALDRIAREEKVLIVLPSGNWLEACTDNQQEAERLLQEYPKYILKPESALTEPATAAIPLTVGSLIQHDRPLQSKGDRIVRPIGKIDFPSPFTRSGPGINSAIKPELVHYGGGLIFHKFGLTARVSPETATSIMSLSHEPTKHLFDFDYGSSLSAPRVANIAARIFKALEDQFGKEPSPNLVRALLALSASVPESCRDILDPHVAMRICGYGIPDWAKAAQSTDRRVTLVAQKTITLDHFDVFEVPIPDCFKKAERNRGISVALAYDPPVRARRYDYLGVLMEMYLIKGKTKSEIRDAFKKAGPDEDPEEAIPQKYRIALSPSSQGRNCGYIRKRSTLQKATKVWKRRESTAHDSGSSYFLVVRAERKWAPPEIVSQDYAVAVTLEANDGNLYTKVSERVQARQKQLEKAKARVQTRG